MITRIVFDKKYREEIKEEIKKEEENKTEEQKRKEEMKERKWWRIIFVIGIIIYTFFTR